METGQRKMHTIKSMPIKGSLTINDERSMNLAAYRRSVVGRLSKLCEACMGRLEEFVSTLSQRLRAILYIL
jgi:hypothetical protein